MEKYDSKFQHLDRISFVFQCMIHDICIFASSLLYAYPNQHAEQPGASAIQNPRLYGVLLSNIAIFILIYCNLFVTGCALAMITFCDLPCENMR